MKHKRWRWKRSWHRSLMTPYRRCNVRPTHPQTNPYLAVRSVPFPFVASVFLLLSNSFVQQLAYTKVAAQDFVTAGAFEIFRFRCTHSQLSRNYTSKNWQYLRRFLKLHRSRSRYSVVPQYPLQTNQRLQIQMFRQPFFSPFLIVFPDRSDGLKVNPFRNRLTQRVN